MVYIPILRVIFTFVIWRNICTRQLDIFRGYVCSYTQGRLEVLQGPGKKVISRASKNYRYRQWEKLKIYPIWIHFWNIKSSIIKFSLKLWGNIDIWAGPAYTLYINTRLFNHLAMYLFIVLFFVVLWSNLLYIKCM